MAYTATDLLQATRNLLNEATPAFFTDAEIAEWINHATLDISTVARCVEATSDLGVTLGQPDIVLPTDCIAAMHVVWTDTQQGLRKITPSMVGEHTPELDSDRPYTWFEWARKLWISPVPNNTAAGHNVTVYYSRVTSNPVDLPDAYQWLTVTYATYRGKLKDKLFGQAGLLYEEYAKGVTFRRVDINQREAQTEADIQLAARAAGA